MSVADSRLGDFVVQARYGDEHHEQAKIANGISTEIQKDAMIWRNSSVVHRPPVTATRRGDEPDERKLPTL